MFKKKEERELPNSEDEDDYMGDEIEKERWNFFFF